MATASQSLAGKRLKTRWVWLLCLWLARLPASAFIVQPYDDKWGVPGFGNPGGVVTWSLMPDNTPVFPYSLQSFLPAGFHLQLEMAFAAWAAVANISFVEVADNGTFAATEPYAGVIRIGGYQADGPSGVLAFTQQPIGNNNEFSGGSPGGNIGFDKTDLWSLTDAGDSFNFYRTALHEIGHAIGLGHVNDPAAIMYPYYSEAYPAALTSDDIAGARYIYGIPEPSSLTLFSLSLAWIGFRRARPRRSFPG